MSRRVTAASVLAIAALALAGCTSAGETAPEGGDCKISVTSLDNNVIKGTFSATLIALGTGNQKETFVFENGSFSVPFTSSAK